MTTTSAQATCYTTLTSDFLDTITISNSSMSSYTGCHTMSYTIPTMSNITVSNSGIGALSTAQISALQSINISDFKINVPAEFVDVMPDVTRIEKMCEEYPGLKIAFEKFKTTYYLVKDDYDTPKDKRLKP